MYIFYLRLKDSEQLRIEILLRSDKYAGWTVHSKIQAIAPFKQKKSRTFT